MWWYGYPFEDHGDASVDERWRKTLVRPESGFPLSGASERIQTPINRFLNGAPRLASVDDLLEDIARHGA